MSGTMKLAMEFTAIDAASSIVHRLEKNILRLGDDAKKVRRDFEDMVSHTVAGLKSLAVTRVIYENIKPAVGYAADLQEAMVAVKMNIASSAENAGDLQRQLEAVKTTAISVAANQPFTATQVAGIENELVKAGLKLPDVTGAHGAAWATGGLSALSKMDPGAASESMGKVSEMFKIRGQDQFKEFADWMSKVDDAASTKIPELFYGLKMAGSGMASLNVSAKETVTALGILSPLGDLSGTALGRFTERLAGVTPKAKEAMQELGFNFFDKGKFIGLSAAIDQVQDKFSKMEDEQERLIKLHKIFGEEGGKAANIFTNAWTQEHKRFRDFNEEFGKGLDIEQKLKIRKESLNAANKDLTTTVQTTAGLMFEPMLNPLKDVANALNEAAGKLQNLAQENKNVPKAVSGAVGVGTAGLAGFGIYKLLRGGLSLGNVLKGMGSTAAGVAEGKALEKIAGVTPVFVTNWPGVGTIGTGSMPSLPSGSPAGAAGRTSEELRRQALERKELGGYMREAVFGSALAAKIAPVAIALSSTLLPLAVGAYFHNKNEENLQSKPLEYLLKEKDRLENVTSDYGEGYPMGDLASIRNELNLRGYSEAIDNRKPPAAIDSWKPPATIEPQRWALQPVDQRFDEIARAVEKVKPEVNNTIKLNIRVDQAGRVTTESSDMKTKTEINVKHGDFDFVAP